jgi:hypothetical protein
VEVHWLVCECFKRIFSGSIVQNFGKFQWKLKQTLIGLIPNVEEIVNLSRKKL